MKNKRQRRILELITKEEIASQKELAERLQKEGFTITQATISRDIKELMLAKVHVEGDRYKYVRPQENSVSEYRLRLVIKEFVISYDASENIVVVNTPPGHASTVCSAIDGAGWPNIIGSLAGDDTVFFVVKPISAIKDVIARLEQYLNS